MLRHPHRCRELLPAVKCGGVARHRPAATFDRPPSAAQHADGRGIHVDLGMLGRMGQHQILGDEFDIDDAARRQFQIPRIALALLAGDEPFMAAISVRKIFSSVGCRMIAVCAAVIAFSARMKIAGDDACRMGPYCSRTPPLVL